MKKFTFARFFRVRSAGRTAVVATFALFSGAYGAEYFVDVNRPDDSGAGTSESTALKTIQAAVAKAVSGDIVTVLPGVYAESPVTAPNDDGGSYSSKSRLYIEKSITLRSRDGAATTHIVGAFDPDSDLGGMGANAVRCITVKKGSKVVIEGFTLRDGASNGSQAVKPDNAAFRAGAVNTSGNVNSSEYIAISTAFTLVDCVVSNCVGTRGGAIYGGTAVRTLLIDNRASNFAAAARQCSLFNCVLARNRQIDGVTSAEIGVVAYPRLTVNCTFVDNGPLVCVAQMSSSLGPMYNTLFVNNIGDMRDAVTRDAKRFYNCVMPDSALASSCTSCVMGNTFEMMAPVFGDYRLVTDAKSLTAGDVEALSNIPEEYRSTDFNGNPRTTDGVVYVGAVQGVGTPLSTVRFHTARCENGSLIVNGNILLPSSDQYASTDVFPKTFHVATQVKSAGYFPSRYWCGGSMIWPSLDDSATMLFPASGTNDVYTVSKPVYYVDPNPEIGSDETGDGSEAAPYFTLQHAIDSNPDGNVVILAREGVYSSGEKFAMGATNRVALTSAVKASIRIKAVGAREKTIIMGASDENSPDGTGCGPGAIRCVFIYGAHLVQGFTLKGGRTGHNEGYSDGDNVRGGGFFAHSDEHQTLADCVITDCCAGRGAAAFKGVLYRCVITNNVVAGDGNSIVRDGRAYSCLIADNNANAAYVSGFCQELYQCTVVSNYNTRTDIWTYPINNNEGSICVNSVIGQTDMSKRMYLENDGIVRNSLLETPLPLDVWENTLTGDPIFAPDGRLYGCSPAAQCGDALQLATPLDINGVPFPILPGGKVIAGCFSDSLPGAIGDSSYPDGISPTTVIPITESTELTFTAVADRPLLRFEVNGVDVGYSEADGVRYCTVACDPALSLSWKIKAVYGTDWYVDAGELGSDNNNGYKPETPFKTLAFAMKKVEGGDTVIAAPGTYDVGYCKNGEDGISMPWNSSDLKTRVFIPEGCRLVSSGGADVTFIKGAADTVSDTRDEYGRGPDAIRCVTMASNTFLKGFTLTGGYTDCENVEFIDNDGGGVYGRDTSSLVEDCVISNNIASRGGGVRYGTVRRCRILGNFSTGMASGVRDAHLFDSLIDGNSGSTSVYSTRVFGCTFGPNVPANHEICFAAATGALVMNCVFSDGLVQACNMSNCVFQSESYLTHTMGTLYWNGNADPVAQNLLAGDGSPLLDDEYRPLRGSPVIDSASLANEFACTDETDLAGSQRIYNNALDCGAFEYDWRRDYSRLLCPSAQFSVTSAPSTCVAEEAGIRLIDGKLSAAWAMSVPRSRFTVSVSVTGGGVLRVIRDGVETDSLTADDGEVSLSYRTSGHSLDFIYARAESDTDACGAFISSIKRHGGMMVVVQ